MSTCKPPPQKKPIALKKKGGTFQLECKDEPASWNETEEECIDSANRKKKQKKLGKLTCRWLYQDREAVQRWSPPVSRPLGVCSISRLPL